MHSIIWFLALAPLLVAAVIWQWCGVGSRNGNIEPWRRVRLGKYGFWLTLGVCYVVMFSAAIVLHKL